MREVMAAPPRVEPHNGREVPVGVPLRDVEDSEGKFDLKKKTKQNLAPKIIESEKQMTEMSSEMK